MKEEYEEQQNGIDRFFKKAFLPKILDDRYV